MGIRCRAHPDQKEHAEYRGRPVNLFENASGKQVGTHGAKHTHIGTRALFVHGQAMWGWGSAKHEGACGVPVQVYLDRATGALVWPVMLLYPEYDQSDFIAEFNDASALEDHFEVCCHGHVG
jgi:hypothetical protein